MSTFTVNLSAILTAEGYTTIDEIVFAKKRLKRSEGHGGRSSRKGAEDAKEGGVLYDCGSVLIKMTKQ